MIWGYHPCNVSNLPKPLWWHSMSHPWNPIFFFFWESDFNDFLKIPEILYMAKTRKDPRNQPLCLVKRVCLIFPNHAKFGLLEASFLIWAIPYRIAAVVFCSILPRKQKLVDLLGLPFKSSPFGAFKKFRSRWIFSCFENCLASTFLTHLCFKLPSAGYSTGHLGTGQGGLPSKHHGLVVGFKMFKVKTFRSNDQKWRDNHTLPTFLGTSNSDYVPSISISDSHVRLV